MKIISEAIRILLFFAVVSVVTTHLDKLTQSVSNVHSVALQADDAFSPALVQEMQAYVDMLRFNGRYNPAALVEHLPRRFASIADVQATMLPNNAALLTVTAQEPLSCLSHDKILCMDGTVVGKEDLSETACAHLTTIHVSDVETVCVDHLVEAVKASHKKHLFDTYHITFIDQHCMRLQDKENPHITIVCCPEALPDESMQQTCTELAQKKCEKQPRMHCIADVRFNDQIVISMEKGGQHGAYA